MTTDTKIVVKFAARLLGVVSLLLFVAFYTAEQPKAEAGSTAVVRFEPPNVRTISETALNSRVTAIVVRDSNGQHYLVLVSSQGAVAAQSMAR